MDGEKETCGTQGDVYKRQGIWRIWGLVWKWGVFGGWVVGLEVLKVFKVLKCLNVKNA